MLTPTGGIVPHETMCHLCGDAINTFFFIELGQNSERFKQYRVCPDCRDNVENILDHWHNIAGKIQSQYQ